MNSLEHRTFKNKQEIRNAVWEFMERSNLVTFPRPCYGRIPNFVGAEIATRNLTNLEEWKEARVIFSAPDSVLHYARFEALKEGKIILVASPGLKGFYLIENVSPDKAFIASTIKGFSKFGKKVEISSNLPKVELYLTGAVACDKKGNRIGKGTGYGDREDEILSKAKLIDENTPRIVLVHDVQVFEDFSPLCEKWDKKVSIIVTPEKIYRVKEG